MRQARVLRNGELVGILTQFGAKEYTFSYDQEWFSNPGKPALSLTLPKKQKDYQADHLFPFFFNMLSEGANLKLQSRQFQIDESDYFGLLLHTARHETIGSITVEALNKEV
ncbi:HipA N-terminal domain-containing protein [Belliella sp. R4-6]|uniref:HipA N-terminal domain-containing protein n=1 Tax=Belliella alkalica TaxID=1730871 RepID=A0ABS9VBX4_9BACT|nr:HipA N-terminal domain-containing protein [Belliella alkalica]MCH7413739.1 HipA N-terminal domain-containing protein [Belliella alkalica]